MFLVPGTISYSVALSVTRGWGGAAVVFLSFKAIQYLSSRQLDLYCILVLFVGSNEKEKTIMGHPLHSQAQQTEQKNDL